MAPGEARGGVLSAERPFVAEPVGQAILTPEARVRVFISSTMDDLDAERQAVRTAVERLRLTPVMFELGARPHPAVDLYRAYLAQSQVFVGVYGGRYGTPDGAGVSGIEDEYVRSAALPRLLYVKDVPDRDPRIAALLRRVRQDGTSVYRRFGSPDELRRLVEDDLAALLSERFLGAGARTAPGTVSGQGAGPVPGAPTRPSVPVRRPPVPSTRTVGREQDLRAITADIARGARLVTVTGPGGVGKSRLALELARRLADRFPDGVAFVPLEEVQDPDRVPSALAAALGVPEAGARPLDDALAEALEGRRVLLVLDNVEHVLPAAPRIAELVDRLPEVVVLATSRERLHLRGETQYPLVGLALPGPDAEPAELARASAVQLFVERATAVDPAFRLGPDNGPAVGSLVRGLDGLPLAIELAAARTRVMSPAVLADRLAVDAVDAGNGAVDMPDRHRSLATAIEWSLQLLDGPDRTLLARLSVFADGATLDAATEVVGGGPVTDVLAGVASLVDKSLLRQDGAGATARLRMLGAVRAHARHLLEDGGELERVRGRHARYFARLSEGADPLLHADPERVWPALESETGNLGEAAHWVLEVCDGELVPTFARGLWHWLWATGRHRVLLDTARRALERAGDLAPRDAAFIAFVAAVAEGAVGGADAARADVDRALCLLRSVEGQAAGQQGDRSWRVLDAAARLLRARLRLATGESEGVGDDLRGAIDVGRAEAVPWLEVAAGTTRALRRAAHGYVVGARADARRAVLAGQESPVLVALAEVVDLSVALAQGSVSGARGRLAWLLTGLDRRPDPQLLVVALDTAAQLAAHEQRWVDVVRTSTAADAAASPVVGRLWWPGVAHARVPMNRARALLPAQAVQRAVATAQESDAWDLLRLELQGSDERQDWTFAMTSSTKVFH